MKTNESKTIDISPEEKERRQKLQIIIDKFEEIFSEFGPVASDELVNRINRLMDSLDKDFKILSESSFRGYWLNKKKFSKKEKNISRNDIPKFLKNYNK